MTTVTTYETIDVTLSDGICTITLQREDVLNAFNNTLTDELASVLKDASRNDEVRVLVITGNGRAFSSRSR
jgi:enoyl-CoA hydratase/carnithine racemase